MARRIVPRRLSHDEEASLVEHLTELRHRLVICLIAIVPAFAVAYVFHDELIERLKNLLPPGTPLVTLGVTEPFTTSLKVSCGYSPEKVCNTRRPRSRDATNSAFEFFAMRRVQIIA